MPKLEHPDSDLVVEALEESVDIYTTQGWTGQGKSTKKARTSTTP